MSVPKKPDAIRKMQARVQSVLETGGKRTAFLSEHATLIPDMVAEGATLTWICDQVGMPSLATVYAVRAADAKFDEAMRLAMSRHASTILDAAQEYSRAAIEHDDIDMAKRADILTRIATSRAEKVAPREYGAMIKHADADGGKLTVSVINYAHKSPGDPSA